MSNLVDAIRDGSVRVGDGAMGTMLQEAGLDDGGAPELWNVEKPDVIAGILEQYASAGSRLLTTNTFGGSLYCVTRSARKSRAIFTSAASKVPIFFPGTVPSFIENSGSIPR